MIPGLEAYLDRMPKPAITGEYDTKTVENRLLAGLLQVPGAYVMGARYGSMSVPALREYVAGGITGKALPSYAASLDLRRYDNPAYQALLVGWADTWQL